MDGRMTDDINNDDVEILEEIKTNVASFKAYFDQNYTTFNDFRLIIYDTSLSQQDKLTLQAQQRPTLEANLLPAQISRLIGEFSSQEFTYNITPSEEISEKFFDDQMLPKPGLPQAVNAQPNAQQSPAGANNIQAGQQPNQKPMKQMFNAPSKEYVEDIKFSEGLTRHLNYIFKSSGNHHVQQEFMRDLLTGGWSIFEMYLDYDNPMSVMPKINVRMPDDVTMCGFDPKAKWVSKGDGDFCFKNFLMSKEDFILYYPHIDISSLNFNEDASPGDWTFTNGAMDCIMVCDYWKKEKKLVDIVQINTGDTIPVSLYKKRKEQGADIYKTSDVRRTKIEKIVRYRVIENQLIETEETIWQGLPLVFGKGDGAKIKENSQAVPKEKLLPYVYHARDIQRFRNYALNTLANEIENIIQHKLMVAQEAYPTQPQWQSAYTDYQNAQVLFYKSRYDDNPEQIIPNPVQPVPRLPAPPEIMQAFQETERTISNILGTMPMPANNNLTDLSGKAVVEAAMQSNPTAVPYVVGLSHAMERVAQVYTDTLPALVEKYPYLYTLSPENETEKMLLTSHRLKQFKYFPGQMKVNIKVGASYSVQKQQAMMLVTRLMQMSPQLQQFFSTKGLPYILDNLEGKNVDALKLTIEDFVNQQEQVMQQQQQMQMQQQQAEMQNNPAMMKMQIEQQKLQMQMQDMQAKHQIELMRINLDKEKMLADIEMSKRKDQLDLEKFRLEHHDRTVNTILTAEDNHHKHMVDTHKAITDQKKASEKKSSTKTKAKKE